jgi:hypothetical protein
MQPSAALVNNGLLAEHAWRLHVKKAHLRAAAVVVLDVICTSPRRPQLAQLLGKPGEPLRLCVMRPPHWLAVHRR